MSQLPSAKIIFLFRTGRCKVGWKTLGNKLTLTNNEGIQFRLQSVPSGVVLGIPQTSQSGSPSESVWQYLTTTSTGFELTQSLQKATIFPIDKAQAISKSSAQIPVANLSSSVQDVLAFLGSFGLIFTFSEKIFQNQKMAHIGTGTLNPKITTEAECISRNAYWVPGENACYTCIVGVQSPDRDNYTCLDCLPDAQCGDQNGYCRGSGDCKENPDQTFSPECGHCGGECQGGCGAAAVFGATCNYDSKTGQYKCSVTKNWWITLLWALFFLLVLIALIYLVSRMFRHGKVAPGTVVYTNTPTGLVPKQVVTSVPAVYNSALGVPEAFGYSSIPPGFYPPPAGTFPLSSIISPLGEFTVV
jgi:hypothetical protein